MREFLQQFGRAIRRSVSALSVVALLALSPVAAHADNTYGSGTYNSGVYNNASNSSSSSSPSSSNSSSGSGGSTPASSSPTNESTVIQTPSGLDVAINLSDGQAIPSTGYYITITPTNGQGQTFDKAEIYLDGQLAYSGAPDSTGTLKWLWNTTQSPATDVKIVVYGPGSGVTTHEFHVTVSPVESSTNGQNSSNTNAPASTPATNGWPIWATWGIVGAVVVVVLLLLVWLIARRRRSQPQLPPPTAFPPAQ